MVQKFYVGVSDQSIHGTPCCIHGGICHHSWEWEEQYRTVMRHVIKAKTTSNASSFLSLLQCETLLNDPCVYECRYDLAVWVEGTYMDGAECMRAHSEVVSARIVYFYPDIPGSPERGYIGWNMNFDEWLPLQPEYQRPKRSAGRLPFTEEPFQGDVPSMIARLVQAGHLSPWWLERPLIIRNPGENWHSYRQRILARDGHTCQYCGSQDELETDHIIPRSRSGSDDSSNLVAACKSCNSSKNQKTPEEWMNFLFAQGRRVRM